MVILEAEPSITMTTFLSSVWLPNYSFQENKKKKSNIQQNKSLSQRNLNLSEQRSIITRTLKISGLQWPLFAASSSLSSSSSSPSLSPLLPFPFPKPKFSSNSNNLSQILSPFLLGSPTKIHVLQNGSESFVSTTSFQVFISPT